VLHNLSFRYKVPIRSSILILVTALLVTVSLMYRAYDDMRRDLLLNAEGMSRVLVRTLVPAMLHDDVWQMYEAIHSAYPAAANNSSQQSELILVLDTGGNTYIANQPIRFPILSDPAQAGNEFSLLKRAALNHQDATPTVVDLDLAEYLYLVMPLISDRVRLGSLVLGFPRSMFLPRFLTIAKRAAWMTLLSLAVLLPITWYWAGRMARPMVQLANCMERLGESAPDHLRCDLYESQDEVGRLGMSFRRMLAELQEKQALERQIVVADRLGAIGRLTSSIAHEINNPLGGMLNAIDTFKRNCDNQRTHRTMSLLERGLLQIRDTVAALLVEAKAGSHTLAPVDIEDIHTLVAPEAGKKSAHIEWHNKLEQPLDLPATPVRQTLINLLLNAVHAVEEGGKVRCLVWADGHRLHLQVANDGRHIPADKLEHLFEPFSPLSESGHGLGLWVCYQIVQQLGGDIHVHSEPEYTVFTVALPYGERE
jgi:signal transduction histidine kinase